MNFRIGNGFDVHALVAGRRLVLGGVTIPHERGLNGHSDADALLHGKIFHDALFHLLKPVVVLIEHFLRALDVLQNLGALLPRHFHEPVDVIAHHRRLG